MGVGLDERDAQTRWRPAAEGARKLFPGRYADQDNYLWLRCNLSARRRKLRFPWDQSHHSEDARANTGFSIALDGLSYFRRPRMPCFFAGFRDLRSLNAWRWTLAELKRTGRSPWRRGIFHPPHQPWRARHRLRIQTRLAQVRVAAASQQVRAGHDCSKAGVVGERLRYAAPFRLPAWAIWNIERWFSNLYM